MAVRLFLCVIHERHRLEQLGRISVIARDTEFLMKKTVHMVFPLGC